MPIRGRLSRKTFPRACGLPVKKTKSAPKSALSDTASKLRTIVLSSEEGALLGTEETLVKKLGVSRATVRQVARLLEREGLLRVRRGINGGYFAARPDLRAIESTVSAYLETLHTESEDVTAIASVLWVEVLRRAARIKTKESKALAEKYLERVKATHGHASFGDVLRIEQESRKAIFDLVESRYIELIFQINTAFAQRHFPPQSEKDDTDAHREFVQAWRHAKVLEFQSIIDGDPELAMMAARHARNIWHRRVWNHDRQ
jgi:GntR family transcriptional regulator, transcriptional repressor for pyruvate dehydrogenase complex